MWTKKIDQTDIPLGKAHTFIGVNDIEIEDDWNNADGSDTTWTNWYT